MKKVLTLVFKLLSFANFCYFIYSWFTVGFWHSLLWAFIYGLGYGIPLTIIIYIVGKNEPKEVAAEEPKPLNEEN